MKKRLSEKNKLKIKIAFNKMKSKEDFLNLLNFVKKAFFGEYYFPFQMKQITYFANPNKFPNRYLQFEINKKSGGKRIINAPVKRLKVIQKCLNIIFQSVNQIHPSAFGFVENKSIYDNAKIHIGQNYVFNLDLNDFFTSIDQARIWSRLQQPPFLLNENFGRLELANIISALLCAKIEVNRKNNENEWTKVYKNVLPQGAPTSPVISNIICKQLDFYLFAVSKKFNLNYSRYADDITFSSMHNVYQKNGDFITEVHRIIATQNFSINENKTRLQKIGFRQEVTGLVVNEKVNVQKQYIKELRMWLYYWESYGYEKTNSFFAIKYKLEKKNLNFSEPNMLDVIGGKLNFLKMIKGVENSTFKNLKNRYNKLIESNSISKNFTKSTPENKIKKTEKSKSSKEIERELNPKDVADFMSLFNKRDGLKYLTHDFDDEEYFEIDKFLFQAQKEFDSQTKLLSIPPNLYSIVKQFGFNSENPVWISSEDEIIKEGFSSLNWKGWSKKNRLHPIRNSHFSQIIEKFRKLTRIESPRLSKIVEKIVAEVFKENNNEFYYSNLDKADFYTHIPSFEKALTEIFKLMAVRKEHKEIHVIFNRSIKDKYFIRELIIEQVGSYPTKELALLEKEWSSEKGAMYMIKEKLRGYCYWSIETEIEGKPQRINILKDKLKPLTESILKTEKSGFKHILTFYYK